MRVYRTPLAKGPALFGLLLLSGCMVGPNYRPPTMASLKTPAQFVGAPTGVAGEADLARWWTSFDDPVLSWLIDRALAGNLDIDVAGARLRQARAAVRGARGALLPTLGANASAETSRTIGSGATAGSRTSFQAGFDAAWEADIFGGLRRSVEAARADQASKEAALHDVQRSVAAEVALNYIDARTMQARLAVARSSLASQDETVQIVGWRVQAGLVSALDLEQAKTLRAQTASTIPVFEQGYAAAVNRLAVLIGEPPGAVTAALDPMRPIPLAPDAFDIGIPATALQRRPDVAAAERTLAAETARIGVATAELYPALNLTGSFTGTSGAISTLFTNGIGSLVAAVSAPIFEGGQIRARIDAQRGAADAALASYRLAVLTALEETENALVALQSARAREAELLAAEAASRNAALYARSQYSAGLIDFQSLLETERSLLSSQDSRVSARSDRATAIVQLYKALGGGWQAAPMPATSHARSS